MKHTNYTKMSLFLKYYIIKEVCLYTAICYTFMEKHIMENMLYMLLILNKFIYSATCYTHMKKHNMDNTSNLRRLVTRNIIYNK